MPQEIKIWDFATVALDAAKKAQFGFPRKPLSVNQAYQPVRKGTHADLILTSAATTYKNDILRMARNQKRIMDWENHDRYFSLWIIVNDKEKVDIDNVHKLIQDTFVTASIIPDDAYAVDTRQMYADFTKTEHDPSTKFVVLIRWGNEISGGKK